MGEDLKRVFKVDIMMVFLISLLVFLNYEVWNHLNSIKWFYFYFMVYFIGRYFGLVISSYLLVKGRIRVSLILSYILYIGALLSVSLVVPDIESKWGLVVAIAPLMGAFVTLHNVAFKNLISKRGKGLEFRRYEALKSTIMQVQAVVMPVLLGFLIHTFSMIYVIVIFVLIGCLQIYWTMGLEERDVEIQGSYRSLWRDVFKKRYGKSLGRRVSKFHVIFLLVGAFGLQFTDIQRQLVLMVSSTNESVYGLILSGSAVLTFVLYWRFRKSEEKVESWFNLGVVMVVVGMWLTALLEGLWMLLALGLIALGMYLVMIIFESMSFELIGKLNDRDRMIVLIKRESLVMFGKLSLVMGVFLSGLSDFGGLLYFGMLVAYTIVMVYVVWVHREIRGEVRNTA